LKAEAQRRADRIRAFREELRELEAQGVLALTAEQRAALLAHHDERLRELARLFDVDTTEAQKSLSWGMRIASFLGALAFCAAAYFFFYRFWGHLSTSAQVVILIAGPLAFTLATHYAARLERTLYFASLAALLALACFVLNLAVLGSIFNITPTPNALLVWSAFALVLAYAYGLRLLLAGGILCFIGFMGATTAGWRGIYWFTFLERPENFIIAGLLVFCVPLLVRHPLHPEFPPVYRLVGLLGIFLPVLILANWGESSYLLLDDEVIEGGYQVAGGLVLSSLAIWVGIRKGWGEVTHLSCSFFVILLFMKFFDWWWDWMPKYLFFLILGLAAVVILVLLKRLRALTLRRAS